MRTGINRGVCFSLLGGSCSAPTPAPAHGFARKTAAPFDVFYWLQVTNFDVLFDSAPKGANHFDVWDFGIHAKMDLAGEFIAYPNIGNRRTTGYRTKVPSRQSRRANVYEVGIASTQCLSWRDYL